MKDLLPVHQEQFSERATSIFYARLAIDFLGVCFLLIPSWRHLIFLHIHKILGFFFLILFSHTFSYIWLNKKWDKIIYFISLCFDLIILTMIIILTGGLSSPLMSGHTLYAIFFVLLYPNPLAILPPLLLLPIITKISLIMGNESQGRDLFLLLWYSGLDLVILYIIVRFDVKEKLLFKNAIKSEYEKRKLMLAKERQHIAREMHDGIGALLSGLTIQAEFIKSIVETENRKELKSEIDELYVKVGIALDELRRTMRIMRDDFEFENSLDELMENMKIMWNYDVSFNIVTSGCIIPQEYQLNLYRIIQETLSNTGKHANATSVVVNLQCIDTIPDWVLEQESNSIFLGDKNNINGLEILISDNGTGSKFTSSPKHHYGIDNLKERTEEMNGFFDMNASDEGTTILIFIPL